MADAPIESGTVPTDKALVKTAVEQTKLYNNMVTGQLLVLLDANESGA